MLNKFTHFVCKKQMRKKIIKTRFLCVFCNKIGISLMKTQRNAYYALFLCKIISVKKQCFCYKITNRMLQISQ